jgi:hypothetical protein
VISSGVVKNLVICSAYHVMVIEGNRNPFIDRAELVGEILVGVCE